MFPVRAYGVLLIPAICLHASVIGVSKPAEPLTRQRVMQLPASQRGPWLDYLDRSSAQMSLDRAALAKERAGLKTLPPPPTQGFSGRAMPLDRRPEFYRSAEARRIGDAILSFQISSGGWSKNLALDAPRLLGQSYAPPNAAPVAQPAGDFDRSKDEGWHYIGTIDNDATNTELHFLAKLSAAFPARDGDAYRTSFLRGVKYLLHAQYPNGGWPQIWPLEGGYHDAITFNDDAVVESVELLSEVAGIKLSKGDKDHSAPEDVSFVPQTLRVEAAAAVARGLDCILKAQIRAAGGVLTVWPQQADTLTLAPVAARNYEPAAFSSGESAQSMLYLMSLEHPSSAVVSAVHGAAAWFEGHKIMGYVWSGGRDTPGGRKLMASHGAGPIWSRYYSLETGKPIFGDRDKTIHDDVMEISLERRNGYSRFNNGPSRGLAVYATWKQTHDSETHAR